MTLDCIDIFLQCTQILYHRSWTHPSAPILASTWHQRQRPFSQVTHLRYHYRNPVGVATYTLLSLCKMSCIKPNSSLAATMSTNFRKSDQLYFDRIHAAVPILHQRRYLSWSRLSEKARSRTCLQYAVWAAASLVSAHAQSLQHTLYSEVKKLLATTVPIEVPGGQGLVLDVELVQAWILITTFEFIKMDHYEACLSAAHTFRLAQLMGLHQVDVPDDNPSINERDLITIEERRRVFWMAFTLEILLSMHSNLPLIMNEHMVS